MRRSRDIDSVVRRNVGRAYFSARRFRSCRTWRLISSTLRLAASALNRATSAGAHKRRRNSRDSMPLSPKKMPGPLLVVVITSSGSVEDRTIAVDHA